MPRISSVRAAALALTTLAATRAAHAQVIVNLAPLADPLAMTTVRDISADGSTICGVSTASRAVRWDNVLGLQLLDPALGSEAYALNANGTIAAGFTFAGNFSAVRYLPGNSIQNLGLIPSAIWAKAYAVSDSGSVVTGESPQGSLVRAFRWDNGTLNVLPIPAGYSQTIGYAVSGDGSAIFGAVSLPGNEASRWRVGFPPEVLGNLASPTGASLVQASNSTGTVAVGVHLLAPGYQSALAFRWTQGLGFEELALPFFASEARALDLTSDTLAVTGSVQTVSGQRAAFWTETGLWIDLNDYLPTIGINLSGWVLTECVGVSDDGTFLCGNGTFNGNPAGWLVRNIPPLCGSRIEAGPTNTAACANTTTQLVCIATPASTLSIQSHQWYKRVVSGTGYIDIPLTSGPTGNGSTLVNASGLTPRFATSSLGFTNVAMADAGDYFCIVTSGCGSNTTALVNLIVRPNINNDNVVDGADLSVLLANFDEIVTPWTNGDFNGDGIVNGADLSLLLANFGQPCA